MTFLELYAFMRASVSILYYI